MLKLLANYTVLYAEDDEGVRNNVSEMLSLLFNKVYVAKDGEQAYDLFLENAPDIVITDIKMPKMNGIELSREIRKTDKKIQILVISAHTEVDYMLDAIELSLMRYIVKPITETKLCEALKKFLDSQESIGTVDLSDGWSYNSDKKVIMSDNEVEHELSKKESKLLELLLGKKSILTYGEIELELWPDETMSLNALRLLMKNFRKKLPPKYLKNVQSIGYKL
jgi:DNA-binding response OmpR family regulator